MKRLSLLLFAFLSFLNFTFSQTWASETKLVANDREADEGFGQAVARTDNLALISSTYEDEDEHGQNPISGAGAVYIFAKQANGKWVEIQKIVASDRQATAHFGQSCVILDSTIIIGADEHEKSEGAVYVFEKGTDGLWEETQKIVAYDKAQQAYFGCSVAASGNYLVVGARGDRTDADGLGSRTNCGSAYVYKKGSDKLWTFNKKLTAINRRTSQRFGCDVSILGKRMAIGAYGDNESTSYPDRGAAFIFELDIDDEWMPIQKITPTIRTGEKFGWAIDLNKDIIVVGAYANWAGASQAYSETGAAYAFEKDKTTGEWTQTVKFIKSNPQENDHFGYDLAIHNSYLVIGARKTNNSRGSVYIYQHQISGNWVALDGKESSHAEVGDYFGTSVDIWNGNLIVGAPGEDDDLDEKNKLDASGSAFILEPSGPLSMATNEKSFIQLYPNPTSGVLKLHFNKALKNAHIQVMDLRGQIVHEQLLENDGEIILDLVSGVYYLSLFSDEIFSGVSPLILINR